MVKIFPQSGSHDIGYNGTYNFNNGRLFIPEVSVLPSVDVPVGSIYHVLPSGKIAIAAASGGVYDTFSLSNLAIPVSPDNIADMAFWYKAESGTQFTGGVSEDQAAASGNPVFLWKDSGPHGRDADAHIGMEPLWFPNGMGPGIDVVQFGGAHLMNISGIVQTLLGGQDAQVTMFALLKFADDSTNQNIFGAGNGGTNNQAWTFRGRVDGGGGSDKVLGTRKADDSAAALIAESDAGIFNTSGIQLIQWRTALGTGQSVSMWQNGSGIVKTSALNVNSATFNQLSLGGNNRVLQEPSLFANVLELFAYSGSISAASRIGIQMYVQNKYGVVMSGA